MNTTISEEQCCPKFIPEDWDGITFNWSEKQFVKTKVFTFMYMPVGFGKVMTKAYTKITEAGAETEDWMALSDHTSLWNMDLYIAVNKEVPGAENLNLNGSFYCKVYEGSYNDTGKWHKDFKEVLQSKGKKAVKTYEWYTTCPKCAKKYGKNYVALFAKIS